MRSRTLDSLSGVSPAQWNTLLGVDYPFLRHEFLAAMEQYGCASPETGWQARHMVLEDDSGVLQAVAPVYLKSHSYGEFVFDFTWADASQRLGRAYYPKLVNAVPFNPVTGPRLLAHSCEMRVELARTIRQYAEETGLSSAHALFLNEADQQAYAQAGYLKRMDCHYQWFNDGFTDFDDFLATLDSKRRKEIRRERRQAHDTGLRYEVLSGADIPDELWPRLYQCYARTYHLRGQPPYLSIECLKAIARQLGQYVRMFIARRDDSVIAMAYMMAAGETLYGRHWGCLEEHDGLHFELCYYQGIEYCIREKLSRFDAGAQGEHKLRRGFEPVATWSAHWLSDARLRNAVSAYLTRETEAIQEYIQNLRAKYKPSPAMIAPRHAAH